MASSLIDTIFRLNNDCLLQRQELLTTYNLSNPEFGAIEILDSAKQISCNNLAEKLSLSVSRISRIADSLVKKGYIRRRDNPENRRIVLISLTKKGDACRDAILALKINCEKRILSKIDDQDISMVKQSIEVLAHTLDKKSKECL